jgi:hypothetical protein
MMEAKWNMVFKLNLKLLMSIIVFIAIFIIIVGCDLIFPGKEVKDDYLIELFKPNWGCKSIKIVETKKERFIIIKTDGSINEEEYYKMLRRKGVSVVKHYDPHTDFGWISYFFKIPKNIIYTIIKPLLLFYEMSIIRKISDMPYTIEISYNNFYKPKEPFDFKEAIFFGRRKIVIQIDKDFGHKFEKKIIYPLKDKVKDTLYFGRYPNSICIDAMVREEDKLGPPFPVSWSLGKKPGYYYVSKDPLDKIVLYFKKKITNYYEKYNIPKKVECHRREGIVNIGGISDVGVIVTLELFTQDSEYWLEIELHQGYNCMLKDIVKIRIRECGNPNMIKKLLEEMNDGQ